MDFPRPADRQFDTPTMISETEMIRLVAKLVGTTGTGMRVGRSTTFEIKKHTIRIQLTAMPNTIRIAGDIQPGLRDLFRDHWDTVRAYTPTSPDDMRDFPVGLAQDATVNFGGGYKPYFVVHAYNQAELAIIMHRIFKVDI